MTLVDPELAGRVLERALARGGDIAELYAEERHGFALSLDDGRVERPQSGRELGASMRVVVGDSTLLRPRGRPRRAGPSARGRLGVPGGVAATRKVPAALPRLRRAEAPSRWRRRPRTWTRRRKAELLRACDERARAEGGEVAQVTRRLRRDPPAGRGLQLDGAAAADDRTRVRLSVQVVAGATAGRDRQRHPRRPRRLRADRGSTRSRWPSRPPAGR